MAKRSITRVGNRIRFEFNPDQPRDSDGKFAGGGGSKDEVAENDAKRDEEWSAAGAPEVDLDIGGSTDGWGAVEKWEISSGDEYNGNEVIAQARKESFEGNADGEYKTTADENREMASNAREEINNRLSDAGFSLVESSYEDGDYYASKDMGVRVMQSGNELTIEREYYPNGNPRVDEDQPEHRPRPDKDFAAAKSKSSLKFKDLKGADIFATGIWNQIPFSADDLDGIVKSFDFFEMGGKVPLKLGHNDEQAFTDGQPALGWVDRIWRDGEKLKADFRDVPTVIYDAIKRGAYKHVSVELLRNVVAGTRTVPLVLDAVALLGADVPAVGTLADLQRLTMSRRKYAERLHFTRDFLSGDSTSMTTETQAAEELRKLREANEALQNSLAIEKARAQSNEDRFTRLDQDTRSAKVTAHRKEIVDMLELAVREKKIQASVRERFMRRFKIETDDAGVMLIPISDVESYIRENPNPFLKTTAVTLTGDPDEIPVGGLPDRELMARARKLCRDRGKDPENWEELKSAGIAVMRADPSLAERYRVLPDDHADGKYQA